MSTSQRCITDQVNAKYHGTHEEEVKTLSNLAKKMIANFNGPKDDPDDSSSISNQKPAWHPPHNPSYNLKGFIEYALG